MDPVDTSGTEKAFEPATGNGTETGRQDRDGGAGNEAGTGVGARVGRGLTLPRPRSEPSLPP